MMAMKTWVRVVLALAVFAAVLWVIDVGAVVEQLRRLSPWVLGLGLLAVYATFPFLAWRWVLLLRGVMARPDPRSATRTYLYALFLNSFSPGAVAGDIYRTLAHRHQVGGVIDMVALLLRERLFGLMAFCGGAAAGVALMALSGAAVHPVFATGGLVCAAVLVGVAISHPILKGLLGLCRRRDWPRMAAFLDKAALAAAFRPDRTLFLPLAASLLSFLFWWSAFLLVAWAMGLALSPVTLMAVTALAEIIRLVPLTFQGGGIREGAVASLVGFAGGDPAAGFALGAVVYALLTLCLLSFGLVGLTGTPPPARAEAARPPDQA